MIALLWLVLAALGSRFKSKGQLEAENMALRHQVMVLRRQVRGRIAVTNLDRLFLVQLYRWFPSILRVLAIVQPQTLIRWQRAGFRRYWRASAAYSCGLFGLLQSGAHTLGPTEAYAVTASGPAIRCHSWYSGLGRPASPVRPDIIFGKDKGITGENSS